MSEGIDYVLDQPCCEDLLPPKLRPGYEARVTKNGAGLRIRRLPATRAGKITQLNAGEQVIIECGPFCDDEEGIIWWRVGYGSDIRGWCAENRKGDGYYLERVTG